MHRLRGWVIGAAIGAIGVLIPPSTLAQTLGPGSLEIVIPAATGGFTDAIARLLAERLPAIRKQQVTVRNEPQEGGNVALQRLLGAPTDGSVFLMGDLTSLRALPTGRALRELRPVTLISETPYLLLAAPGLPVTSLPQLTEYARRENRLLLGMAQGPRVDLAVALLRNTTGANVIDVPYKSAGEAFASALGGQIHVVFAPFPGPRDLVGAGKLRALAIVGSERATLGRDLPRLAPGTGQALDLSVRIGAFMSPRTPEAITVRLSGDIAQALKDPQVSARLAQLGAAAIVTGPGELSTMVREAENRTFALQKALPPSASRPGVPPPSASGQGAPPPMPGTGGPRPQSVDPMTPEPVGGGMAAPSPGPSAPQTTPGPIAPAPKAKASVPQPPPPPPVASVPRPIPPGAGIFGPDPKPSPQPSPQPSAKAHPDAPGALAPAYWNTWFRDDAGRPVERLENKKVYTFLLDLSHYLYHASRSVAADPKLQARLQEAAAQKTISFMVRPVVLGGALEPYGAVPTEPIKVNLDRLRVKSDPSSDAQLAALRSGRLSLDDFSALTSAGQFSLQVVAKGEGCASIALSIWDATGRFPLDHLVHTVNVGARTAADEGACGSATAQLQGGFATLLDAALDRPPAANETIDAALHVFEFARAGTDRRKTVAVLVDKRLYAASAPSARRGVFAWELESTLSTYLGHPQELLDAVAEARKRAASEVQAPYERVSNELQLKLFSGADPTHTAVAQEALKALQQTVSKAPRPTILVRMYKSTNEQVYLPLGLLSARGAARVFDKPITVVQPLPRERYVQSATCIEPWTFGIPERLEGAGNIDFVAAAPGDTTRVVRSPAELEKWLGSEAARTGPRIPEGFLLLSHHARGYLWFDDYGRRIPKEALKREFAPGSVAFLSACSMANPDGDNGALLEKLNRNGVDAMIVSPFPVRADYGTRLARNVVSEIRRARAAGADPTLADLFAAAAQSTARDFKADKSKMNLDEMALEFVLLGDHNIRLCKSRSKAPR